MRVRTDVVTWKPNPIACTDNPDRWADAREPDREAQQLCQRCPKRRACAELALSFDTPFGIWAGVLLPSGRSVDYRDAMWQLRMVAAGVV